MKNPKSNSNIARFLTAQTISLFGSSLVQYAIVWNITISTSSGSMLMLSTLCGFLPQIAISLFAGVWLDRYDRKKIIMLSDTIIAAATLVLALSLLVGYRSNLLLFAVLMVRSAGTGIQTPAVNAIIPRIVPKEDLMHVNGINSTLSSIMMFLSPAMSGAILSVAPLEITLFIDVITAIVGVSITATINIPHCTNLAVEDVSNTQKLKEGFAYLGQNKFVKRLLLFQIAILFLIIPSAFLTPLMVSRSFGAEVWRLTASEMTYSLGMVLGGLLITTWGGCKTRINTTLIAGAVYGCVMIGLGWAPVFWVYLALNTMIGVTSPCYNTPITVSIQESVDSSMQGRIFSLMQIATSCALPMGMVFFGPLADKVPVQLLLVVSGSIVLLISVIMRMSSAFTSR